LSTFIESASIMSAVDFSSFDLEKYISEYNGYTKITRLLFIIDKVPGLRDQAQQLLIQEFKNGCNTTSYINFTQSLDESSRKSLEVEESWIYTVSQQNDRQLELLENELSVAKSSMIKENIRISHNAIGDMFYRMGNINEALKSFLRSREFCTMGRHHNEMCLNVISASIDLNQFYNVGNFINKVSDTGGDALVGSKLKAAAALSDLVGKQFKNAGLKFIGVGSALENKFNNVVSAEDIAIYGTVCALATFNRAELRTHIIDNKSFINSYLNLVPKFKNVALSFCDVAKYSSVFHLLSEVKPRLLCDVYLQAHVETLFSMIHEKLILQYISPYCAVDLVRMAHSLHIAPRVLEDVLIKLISNGQLSARIDMSTNTLQCRTIDARHVALDKALKLAQVHSRAVKRDILRLSLLQQNFVVGGGEGDESEFGIDTMLLNNNSGGGGFRFKPQISVGFAGSGDAGGGRGGENEFLFDGATAAGAHAGFYPAASAITTDNDIADDADFEGRDDTEDMDLEA
jgi:COP9 signalosome complex subunit 1